MPLITIIYSDELLPYCPTVLNIAGLLKQTGRYDVRIVTYEPRWCSRTIDLPEAIYRHLPTYLDSLTELQIASVVNLLRRILQTRSRARSHDRNDPEFADLTTQSLFVKKAIDLALTAEIDWSGVVITVDHVAAFAATIRGKPYIYLSLELYDNELLVEFARGGPMAGLLIQSEARKSLLFPLYSGPTYMLPNTPVFKLREPATQQSDHLVFSGTAWELFGFESCLQFLMSRPDLKMTHSGFCPPATREKIDRLFPELLERGQLILDAEYRAADDLITNLAGFQAGLCFYRLDLATQKSQNNYLTAPSGKLAMYLAAGIPVICSDIPAFQFVRDEHCGVLVANLLPESLSAALAEIEAHSADMSQNALTVAQGMCFARHFEAVQQFLQDETGALVPYDKSRAEFWSIVRLSAMTSRFRVGNAIVGLIRRALQAVGVIVLVRRLLGRNPDGSPRSTRPIE